MKRKKNALVWMAAAVIGLTGCAGSRDAVYTASSASYAAADDWNGGFSDYELETGESSSAADTAAADDADADYAGAGQEYGLKLIKTYSYTFETLAYDESMAYVEQKVAECGGYIESSESGGSGNRYAYLTVRIPVEKSDAFLNQVGEIGELICKSAGSEDVTTSYYDTASRLSSLNTQHERLLELLAQAGSLDDIIALNAQLTDVEYEIDRYTTMLRVYDNKVDYVTVNFTIREVEQVQVVRDDSFRTQIQKGLRASTADVADGLVSLVIFLITGIPYFIVIALVAVVVGLCIRKIKKTAAKKRRKRMETNG